MAEEQYFLKRGDAVKGPFSLQKLQSLLAEKKLKANDLVGVSNDGPWERLAAVHKPIRAGQPLELGTETAAKTEGTVSPPQQPQNPNLIECADCGKAISKRAASCPHCGAPVEDSTAETASGDDEYGYEDDEYGYGDDEYDYGNDEYDYGNDEYGYEDDLSTPDDTYRPTARRKRNKKKKATPVKAEKENNRKLLYLVAGISVLGVCFLSGIGYVAVQVISGGGNAGTSEPDANDHEALPDTLTPNEAARLLAGIWISEATEKEYPDGSKEVKQNKYEFIHNPSKYHHGTWQKYSRDDKGQWKEEYSGWWTVGDPLDESGSVVNAYINTSIGYYLYVELETKDTTIEEMKIFSDEQGSHWFQKFDGTTFVDHISGKYKTLFEDTRYTKQDARQ